MQVSTPTQVPVTTAPAGDQEPKPVQGKSLKHDKRGSFAHILDGLIQKSKPGEPKGGLLGKLSKGDSAPPAPGEPKAKKKTAAPQETPKTKEPLARKGPKDKTGLGETLGFQVPQGSDHPKPGVEPVQKEPILAGSLQSKEKKSGASPQNPRSQTQAGVSGEELSLKQLGTAPVPETGVKGTPEIKKNKSPGKEGKISGSFARTSRNPEGTQGSPQVSARTEKEVRGGSKLGESKARDKRRERGNMEVRGSWEAPRQEPAQGSGEVKLPVEVKTAELTVDLSGGNKGKEGILREGARTPVQGFEDLLARELGETLNGDIVRQAQVILREHGEGAIRLALKPDSLGYVKVQLEMTENKITGHIIVESPEVMKAFERELRSLEQAFKDSGFDGAHLDMSLASGSGGDPRDQGWQGAEGGPFFSERFAASHYDAGSELAAELVQDGLFGEGSGAGLPQVNMLA